MNERQKSLLLFIARNRLVSFQEIHRHFGGDAEALRKNLRLFRASNVGFIKPCDQDVEERNPVRPVHYGSRPGSNLPRQRRASRIQSPAVPGSNSTNMLC